MENLTQSENISELITALSIVQGKIKPVAKDAINPFFNSKYTTLESVVESCRGLLSENGLAVIQTMTGNPGEIGVTTTLAHKSGQWIRGTLYLKPVKDDPQKAGSAITYARRYSWMAIIGLVPDEDDDGNDASGKPKKKQPEPFIPVTDTQKEQSTRLFNYLTAHYNSSDTATQAIFEECNVKSSKQISSSVFAEMWKRHEPKIIEFETVTEGK